MFCYLVLNLKTRYGYDYAIDVVAVHGVGGFWGAIATGLFATASVNPDGASGLFFGNPGQLLTQFIGAVVVMAFSLIVSAAILKVIEKTMGLRVSEEDEVQGLDLSQHGEVGYLI